jgi:3-oxoacyl-[acyl-carrier protein] reductase
MRNIIVTGGSRGIGLGIAKRLAGPDTRVLAVARKPNPLLDAAIADAEKIQPGALQFVPFDLAEIEGIPELVKTLRRQYGSVSGLVNNAGISFEGVLAMMPVEQMEQLVRVNTLAPMVLSKHVVRSMMADGGGRIVNISSITALTGYSGLSVYSATKASLLGFTRSLAREVGPMGVTVNSVAPGFIDTELTESLTEEDRHRIERRSALKRLATVADVAGAVAFLLSEEAKNITGTVLTVDAGNIA